MKELLIDLNFNQKTAEEILNKNSVELVHIGPNNTQTVFPYLFNRNSVNEFCNESKIQIDLRFINTLSNLKEIIGEPCKINIELDNPSLEKIYCTYVSGFGISDRCINIKQLGISSCPKSEKLLKIISKLSSLEYLCLHNGNINTLEIFGSNLKIKELRLYSLKKLTSLSGIKKLSNSLENFTIESVKKIETYSPIGNLVSLKKLVIARCKPMDDLSFLKNLHALERLVIRDTKILAKDLSHLENIKEVCFLNTGID